MIWGVCGCGAVMAASTNDEVWMMAQEHAATANMRCCGLSYSRDFTRSRMAADGIDFLIWDARNRKNMEAGNVG